MIADKFTRSIKTTSARKAAAFRRSDGTSHNGLFMIEQAIDLQ